MKVIYRTSSYLLLFVLIASMGVPISCSSSNDYEETESAMQITARLKALFMNDKGELDLVPIVEGGSEYVTPCENEAQASDLCKSLLDGMNETNSGNRYILPDDYGYVRVIESETEGIYVTLSFDIKDIPPFTMHITSDAFFENINNDGRFIPMWKCTKCGKEIVMRQRPSPCCTGGTWILIGNSRIPTYA